MPGSLNGSRQQQSAEGSSYSRFRDSTYDVQISDAKLKCTLMLAEGSRLPVLFLPGLGLSCATYLPLLEAIYQRGISFLAVERKEMPGSGQKRETVDEEKFQHALAELEGWRTKGCVFSDQQVRRAVDLVGVLEKQSIPKPMEIVAHSAGAVQAVLAATLRLELFPKILLPAPAGMIEEDNPHRLWEAATDWQRVLEGKLRQLGWVERGEYDQPFFFAVEVDYNTFLAKETIHGDLLAHRRTGEEAATYIAPMAAALRKKGVDVSVEIGSEDHLFPPELIKPWLEKNGIPCSEIVGEGHFAIGTRAAAIKRIVDALSP